MSGLFRRLSSRRSEGPAGNEPPPAAQPGAPDAPANTPAEPGGQPSLLADPAAPTQVIPDAAPAAQPAEPAAAQTAEPAPAEPATLHRSPNPMFQAAGQGQPLAPVYPPAPVAPVAPVPVADLPAGIDPDELTAVPATSARRSRLRRRVAFLRAARELLLRDLGGFVYELHRTAGDVEHATHRQLRDIKLGRLTQVDAELHTLEFRLDDVRRQVLVREPGVGGECPDCGELFSSAAHYCSHCGLPLTESARRATARARQPEPAPDPVIVPAAAAVAPKDQPTEEIPPLDPEHPEAGTDFQWPRRDAADTSWTAAPADAPTGAGAPSAASSESEAAATPDAPTVAIGETDDGAAAPAMSAETAGEAEAPTGETDDGAAAPAMSAETAGEAEAPTGETDHEAAAPAMTPEAADETETPTGETDHEAATPAMTPEAADETETPTGETDHEAATPAMTPDADGEAATPEESVRAPEDEEPAPENGSVLDPVERRP